VATPDRQPNESFQWRQTNILSPAIPSRSSRLIAFEDIVEGFSACVETVRRNLRNGYSLLVVDA
jgi:hypothetical protein